MEAHNDSAPRFVRPNKDKEDEFVGLSVESKISVHRLAEKIEPREGSLHILARDFRRDGGIVREVSGHSFLIEVNSGSFVIPRNFVRPA
jgi:hypothetical protein